jgi:hypothetical protein
VFLWFVGIGALTVAMSGGMARRPKRATPVREPEPEPEMVADEPEPEPEAEPEDELPEPEAELGEDDAAPIDPGPPREAEYPEYPDYPDYAEDPEDHFVTDDDAAPGSSIADLASRPISIGLSPS